MVEALGASGLYTTRRGGGRGEEKEKKEDDGSSPCDLYPKSALINYISTGQSTAQPVV